MIATSTIKNILYKDCQGLGIKNVYHGDNMPTGKITEKRVVLHVHRNGEGNYWRKVFVDVNVCIPELRDGIGDMVEMEKAEKAALAYFKPKRVGKTDNMTYTYSYFDHGIEYDEQLRCHYCNIKLLFKILNTF